MINSQQQGAPPPAEAAISVLLVDDHWENLVALEAILADLNLHLVSARSGEEALGRVLERDFALILLDIAMPGLDGFQTADRIRARPSSHHVPIIFLTAFQHSDIQLMQGYAAGAVDYLIKPIDPSVLRSKVKIFVELHQQKQELQRQAELLRRSMLAIVAEQKRTAEERRRREELEEFAHIASHDLREPLRALSTFGQILSARYRARFDGEASEYLRFIVEGASRISRLIDDLVTYTEINAESNPGPERVRTGELCEDALEELEEEISRTSARISIGPLPELEADADQLRLVFSHLIGNALKFRGPTPPEIHVEASFGNDHWLFEVRDNGLGFEPRFAERIFLLFKRLHPNGTYDGTGMGLALCKRIIERHHGRIWAEAEPGKGASFFFTLPARQVETMTLANHHR